MKIGLMADIHLGALRAGSGKRPLIEAQEKSERRDAFRAVFGELEGMNVDVVAIAGDVFDTPNPSPEDLVCVSEMCDRLDVVLIHGNHDAIEAKEGMSATTKWTEVIRRMSTNDGVTVFGELAADELPVIVGESDGTTWAAIPWHSPERIRDILARLGESVSQGKTDKLDFLLMHQNIEGAIPNVADCEVPGELLFKVTRSVLAGDIHRRLDYTLTGLPGQEVRVVYPGPSDWIDKDQYGHEGACVVEVAPGVGIVSVERVPNPVSRRLFRVRLSGEGEGPFSVDLSALNPGGETMTISGDANNLDVVIPIDFAPELYSTGFDVLVGMPRKVPGRVARALERIGTEESQHPQLRSGLARIRADYDPVAKRLMNIEDGDSEQSMRGKQVGMNETPLEEVAAAVNIAMDRMTWAEKTAREIDDKRNRIRRLCGKMYGSILMSDTYYNKLESSNPPVKEIPLSVGRMTIAIRMPEVSSERDEEEEFMETLGFSSSGSSESVLAITAEDDERRKLNELEGARGVILEEKYIASQQHSTMSEFDKGFKSGAWEMHDEIGRQIKRQYSPDETPPVPADDPFTYGEAVDTGPG